MGRFHDDRVVLRRVFQQLHGREPSLEEAQIIQAIGEHETNWGRGWSGDGVGSNNVGAVQCSHGPPCDPGECFQTGDSHLDGSKYQWCYKKYPDLDSGARDLIILVTKRRPETWKEIQRGDYYGTAAAMQREKYHETPATTYGDAISRKGQKIAEALSERFVEPTDGYDSFKEVAWGTGLMLLGYALTRRFMRRQ